jgi:quinol-cytochrome oxidoreductase complex cytochrome b subunit
MGESLYGGVLSYHTPTNLSYGWNAGSVALQCLALQIGTGILLAINYTPHALVAFNSIEHTVRDVHFGWHLRYFHSMIASIFFIAIYIHMARGIFYGSFLYPRQLLWTSGVLLFLCMIITAFLGYVLPCGQMSFWAATVITNLFSAIPFFWK